MNVLKIILKFIKHACRYPIQIILNFIYPPYCFICEKELSSEEKIICRLCWQNLPKLDQNDNILNELKLKHNNDIYFSKAVSIWEFSKPIQKIIHQLKYQNGKILANTIGFHMAEYIKSLSPCLDNFILIPVPLHNTRKRERGYNQSTLICKAISKNINMKYDDKILKRIRYTTTQTKLNLHERSINVQNAFKFTQTFNLNNKICILIDDVITTGSTMNACARELKKHGAKDIYLLSASKA